jgi:hypothetical protein
MQALLITSAINFRANTTNYKPRISRVGATGSTVQHGVVILADYTLLIPNASITSMNLGISSKSLSLCAGHYGHVRHYFHQVSCNIAGLVLIKSIFVTIL